MTLPRKLGLFFITISILSSCSQKSENNKNTESTPSRGGVGTGYFLDTDIEYAAAFRTIVFRDAINLQDEPLPQFEVAEAIENGLVVEEKVYCLTDEGVIDSSDSVKPFDDNDLFPDLNITLNMNLNSSIKREVNSDGTTSNEGGVTGELSYVVFRNIDDVESRETRYTLNPSIISSTEVIQSLGPDYPEYTFVTQYERFKQFDGELHLQGQPDLYELCLSQND